MEHGFSPRQDYSSNGQDLHFSLTKDKGQKTKDNETEINLCSLFKALYSI
jgi:hypothetical protein